jgi:hypothetical protein
LTIEGPECFVESVRDRAGRPELVLLDGRELALDAVALTCDPDGRLWLLLPEGKRAYFMAAAQLELSPWLSERDGVVGLQIQQDFSAIAGASTTASAEPHPKPGS